MNPDHSKTKFIVIEGIDGAGTTTQSQLLVDWLVTRGRKCSLTAEPSRGPVGLLLRQILSGRTIVVNDDGGHRPIHNDVIALLFAADRIDHLDSEVLPLLDKSINVVSDRYYHSSLTYQSLSGDLSWIGTLNSRARTPDVTYLLDVPADQAATRRHRVRSFDEIYEVLETQKKLEVAYRSLPELLKDEVIVIVDGNQDPQAVHQAIKTDLAQRFGWS
ncbi:MAG: dTMP kinase [Deltaproteobacteria bacterium]|nr:dTMP kinase [Deltaproteobacteria bacterium]